MHLDDFRVFYMHFVLHFWWIFVFGWYDMCSCTQEMFSSVSTSMFTLFGTVSSWSLMKFVPLFEETLAISEPVWTDLNVQEWQCNSTKIFFCVLNFTTIYTREVTWLYLYFVNMCPICNSDMKRLGGFASFRSPAFPTQRSVFSR